MSERTIRLYEEHSVGVCRACGAPLHWHETLTGKQMPMEADAVPRRSESEAGTGRVVAHYAASDAHWNSCPQAERFR